MRKQPIKYLICLISFFVMGLGTQAWQAQGFEVNKNALVLLVAKDKSGEVLGTGSGFIVKPEGTLITNYHVLVDAHSMDAVFTDGSRVPVSGIIHVDRKMDFALLQLGNGFYSTLEVGNSDLAREYDYTSALGFLFENVVFEGPSGARGRVIQTYGFILGYHPQAFSDFSFIYTTTPFGPGFSGGPLVDKQNKVVGLATVEGRSINLALPINYVKPFLNKTGLFTLQELVAQDRESKEAMYYRGNYLLYVKGEPQEAVREFEKVLRLDPGFILAYYDLGAAYANLGMIEKSMEQYSKAIELNPKFPEALSNLGGYYFRQGDVKKAVSLFKQAIDTYPNFIQALSNLGAALNKVNRSSEAVSYLEKAISLDPEFGIISFNLGNSKFALGKWDEALAQYDKAVKLGVDFLSLHWKRFEIHQRQGKQVAAQRELDMILQIDPNNPEALQKQKEFSPLFR